MWLEESIQEHRSDPLLSNSIRRAGSFGRIIEIRGYHSGSGIKFTPIPMLSTGLALISLTLVGTVAYAAYALKLI